MRLETTDPSSSGEGPQVVDAYIDLTMTEAQRFCDEARRRGVSDGELIARIVKIIAQDDLFVALLD